MVTVVIWPATPSKFLLNWTSQSGVGCTSFISFSHEAWLGVLPCRASNRKAASAAFAVAEARRKRPRERLKRIFELDHLLLETEIGASEAGGTELFAARLESLECDHGACVDDS